MFCCRRALLLVFVLASNAVVAYDEDPLPADEWDESAAENLMQVGDGDFYPAIKNEPALVSLELKTPLRSRQNKVSGKTERRFALKLMQENMSLYKTGDKKHHSTSLYDPNMNKDMFCVMRQWDISKLPPVHIVEFKPSVTRVKGMTFDSSIVHHMDFFLCTDKAAEYPVQTTEFPAMSGNSACDSMPWAYDRDGHKLVLPDHVGAAMGKGTPYTRVVVEWHYLLAKNGVDGLHNIGKSFTDHSSIQLTVTPDLRKHSAGTLGVMQGNMRLQPGKRRLDNSYITAPGKLDLILGHDLKKFGSLKPVAVHLHMHNHGRAMNMLRVRGGEERTIGEIGKYKGFGTDQSFFLLDKLASTTSSAESEARAGHFRGDGGTDIRAGDRVQVSCVFDTRCKYGTPINDPKCIKASHPIEYGLSHGKEMCGAILMYYPHDPAVRMKNGMVLGYGHGDLMTPGKEEN